MYMYVIKMQNDYLYTCACVHVHTAYLALLAFFPAYSAIYLNLFSTSCRWLFGGQNCAIRSWPHFGHGMCIYVCMHVFVLHLHDFNTKNLLHDK